MGTSLKAFYEDYYDDGASKWREVGAVAKAANLRLLWERHVNQPREPTVLEIGCGEGAVLAEISSFGWQVEGVELSASGVTACKARGLSVGLIDGSSTHFDDDAFDVVLLTHVVEHLEHPRELITEAARVGRYAVIEVPLEYRWRTPSDFKPNAVGHINLFDKKLIRQLIQSTGLRVDGELISNPPREVFITKAGAVKGSLWWATREVALRLLPGLSQRLFTYHATLICHTPHEEKGTL